MLSFVKFLLRNPLERFSGSSLNRVGDPIGTNQADINNLGLRAVLDGGQFVFPSLDAGGWTYDAATSTWMAKIPIVPFLTRYDRSTTKTYSNLTISVTP